jgi:hypothetical protein
MGFNSGKIKVQSTAKKQSKNAAWDKDMPWSLAGQWKYPGQVTKVPSGDITMQGVNYPVFGVDNLGNEQMMMPGGDYQFPGNMVTEYPLPMAQMGDAGKAAYEKYQQNITDTYGNMLGTKFRPDMSNMPDAEGFDPGDFNCIGGACNFVQGAGADVPIIPGNSSFWEQAQSGDVPVKVYGDPSTEDYSTSWDFVKPGDFIGHDLGPGAGKNLYYPEHTNVFLRWDTNPNTGKKVAVMMDANTGEDHSYAERTYNYDELVNPRNKSFFFGRPTSVGGQKLDFNYPAGVSPSYFPKVSQEKLDRLNDPKWNIDTTGLNAMQVENLTSITDTLSNKKKDFIKATGMSEADYDKIANIIPGLANQESGLGNTLGMQGMIYNPARAMFETAKTVGKQVTGGWPSRGLLQVRDQMLFSNPDTRVAMKRLGFTEDNYDPDNAEHNTMASMVLMDNINKTSLKGFDKVKGNNPDLSLEEKLLYLYNNPGAVKRGEAEGKSTYVRNIKDFKKAKASSRPRPINPGMYQFGGENYNDMNLPEGYHMMPDGTVMLDSAMEYGRGGAPCYECGGGIPHMAAGGNWMADIKSTGQCTGANFGGPNCRPGTREYAFAKRARAGEFKKVGGSTAPQNTTIDTIGNKRIKLLENELTANTMNFFTKQYENQLKQRSLQEMNQFKKGGGYDTYNPNMSYAGMYADEITQNQNNINRDFDALGNAIGVAAGNERRSNAIKSRQGDIQTAQTQWAKDMEGADGSMYNFANPNQNVPSNFNPGMTNPAYGQYDFNAPAGTYSRFGGQPLPMAQKGVANTRDEGFWDQLVRSWGDDNIKSPDIPWGKMIASGIPGVREFRNLPETTQQQILEKVRNPGKTVSDLYFGNEAPWYPQAATGPKPVEPVMPTLAPGASQAEQQVYNREMQAYDQAKAAYDTDMSNWMANKPVDTPQTTTTIDPLTGKLKTVPTSPLPGLGGDYTPPAATKAAPKKGGAGKGKGKVETPDVKDDVPGVTRTVEAKKPNYKETKEGADEESSTTMGGREDYYPTYGSGPFGGTRKRKFKMVYTDPVTGKKVRIKDKSLYDGAGYPVGGGRGYAGPRNIRIKNKDFTVINGQMVPGQSNTDYAPGQGVMAGRQDIQRVEPRQADLSSLYDNQNPSMSYTGMTPFNNPGSQPGTFRRTVTDVPNMSADETRAYEQKIQQAREAKIREMAQGYLNQGNGRPAEEPVAGYAYGGPMNYMQTGGVDSFSRIPMQEEEAFYVNAPMPEATFVDPMIDDYMTHPGISVVGPSRRSQRIDRRFNKALNADEAQAGYRNGGSYFPQPYPGGMQPNGQGAYFFVNGGNATVGDDSYALSSDAWMHGTGLFGNQNQQQENQVLEVDKMKTVDKAQGSGFGDAMNTYGVMLSPMIDMISSGAEARKGPTDLQKENLLATESTVATNPYQYRGSQDINTGKFGIDNLTFATSRYGGQPQYQDGGEYDLTDQEIAYIESMGGTVQYI